MAKKQQRVTLWIDPCNDPPRLLTQAQAQALGRQAGDEADIAHLWFEVRLRGGWRAFYRLLPREGRPVVAELRLLPERGDLPDLRPAEWAVEVLGFEAAPLVPGDGITAGLIKDQVIPGRHIYELLPAFLTRFGKDPMGHQQALRRLFEPWLEALGLKPEAKPHAPRRGPKGWPDREYAELAAFYVERCEAGSHSPAKDAAEHFGMEPGAFRQALRRAAERALLTRTTGGRAGGRLTAKAKRLLAAKSSRNSGSRKRSRS